ncbi:MAG TPA: SDR family oxidoreductase [Rhizomicrobium sp.]|jgi:NAD(P)-dependent dehydrogenase (short-subunit alcohol dehydrogenase family)|nr:SDR family oxidoreductase [Rhizomicrobium sp.]
MTTVVVTGANRGIGLEFVRQYAGDGAKVIACARDPHHADVLKELSVANSMIDVRPLDVSDFTACAALGKDLAGEPIDILINNAGTYGPKRQDADDMDFEGWAYTFAVNTMGPLALSQALHENLKRGREKRLITITSGMASTATTEGGYLAYRASKAAVNNVMRNLSVDWRRDRIIAVVISPGWVRTDMGGAGAPLLPEQSVSGMRKVIAGLTLSNSGKFLNWDSGERPW